MEGLVLATKESVVQPRRVSFGTQGMMGSFVCACKVP